MSSQSSSSCKNLSKFHHDKPGGMSLSTGFSESLIDNCIKFHCQIKNYLFVQDKVFDDFGD